jgi:hypothetical protein
MERRLAPIMNADPVRRGRHACGLPVEHIDRLPFRAPSRMPGSTPLAFKAGADAVTTPSPAFRQ